MAHHCLALVLTLLGCCLLSECAVFLNQEKASSVLQRYRRYNSGYLEELLQGNLERECREELCNFEEAREVFEDYDQTVAFWKSYSVICSLNNGGCDQICTDDPQGKAVCSCFDGYKLLKDKKSCELSATCATNNGGCQQICRNESTGRAVCSCVDEYKLLEDQKSCEPIVAFSCGTVTLPETIKNLNPAQNLSYINNTESHQVKLNIAHMILQTPISNQNWGLFNSWKGQVPWQVYMFSFDQKEFCEGALISDKWVITAARCLVHNPHTIIAGEYDTRSFEHSEQLRQIQRAVQHPGYNKTSKYENDLALLELNMPLILNKYVTPICIGNKALTEYFLEHGKSSLSGWWKLDYLQKKSHILQRADIQYVDQVQCLQGAKSHLLPNLFCAGHPNFVRRIYHDNSGSPFATAINNTWFLTGIATCGQQCTGNRPYDIFTSIADKTEWIRNVIRGEH